MKRRLREDVNGFTFKDLFEKDFDEVLVEALQVFEELVASGDFSWTNIFKDKIDPSVVENTVDSGIVADVVYALLDKIKSFKDYNALRVDLGLDEIEVDEVKEESVNRRLKESAGMDVYGREFDSDEAFIRSFRARVSDDNIDVLKFMMEVEGSDEEVEDFFDFINFKRPELCQAKMTFMEWYEIWNDYFADKVENESVSLKKKRVQEAKKNLKRAKRTLHEALIVSSMGETNMGGSGRTTFVSGTGSVSKNTRGRRHALLND